MSLDRDLARSSALSEFIEQAWLTVEVSAGTREQVVGGLCLLCLEHGRALRVVMLTAPSSGIALLRPQYEALVRAVWALHTAGETDLARLLAPLNLQTQQAARKLPGVAQMLSRLEMDGPPGAARLLHRAKDRLWDALNSFVHGGIHPFRRGQEGYPVALLQDVLKNSNAFSVLTLILLAEICDEEAAQALAHLHAEFADVLPSIEE